MAFQWRSLPDRQKLVAVAACAVALILVIAGCVVGGLFSDADGHPVAHAATPAASHLAASPARPKTVSGTASPADASVVATHTARHTHQAPTVKRRHPVRHRRARKPHATLIPGSVRLPHGGTAFLVRQRTASDGTLPVPNRLDEAAWWGAGVHEHGAMLLSGHINWAGKVGPFDELWRDHQGQRIWITSNNKSTQRYVISRIITLHKNELGAHAQRLFSQSGPHRLVLVTCGGRFVGGEQGYDENRIVVAKPV